MAEDIPIIDLEMDEEPVYVSTLGGRPNEQIPYEVVDVDVENDEIDDCIFKGDDFDLIARPGATEIRFKNKLVIGYMAEEQVGCVINREQLRELLTEMLEMYNNRDEIDWSFKNIDLTLLREAKPKLERNGTSRGITCNAMLNDIIRVVKQMNSKDIDDVYFANWMLEQYAAFFEQKPTGKYKVGSLSAFVREDLMKQEAILHPI